MTISRKRVAQLLIAVGAALIAVGVGYIFISFQLLAERGLSWWAQVSLFFVGGGACGCWGLIADKGYAPPVPREEWPEDPPDRDTDTDAIRHLADRLRDHPHGLKLCRELADCVFSVHHGCSRPVTPAPAPSDGPDQPDIEGTL
jgi:hypothetical protein